MKTQITTTHSNPALEATLTSALIAHFTSMVSNGLFGLLVLAALAGPATYCQAQGLCLPQNPGGGSISDAWSESRNGIYNSGFQPCETAITASKLPTMSVYWQDYGGLGNSTPAVVQNNAIAGAPVSLYIQSTLGEFVVAYDANGVQDCSGGNCSPIWSYAWPNFYTGNESAPAASRVMMANGVSEPVVFTSDGSALTALNAGDGTVLWTATLPQSYGSHPSFTTSPLISGGVLNAVVYMGADDGHIYAFAGRGGTSGCPTNCSPLWVSATNYPVSGSPAWINVPGVGNLVVAGDSSNSYPPSGGVTFYYADNNNQAGKNAGDIYWENHSIGPVPASPVYLNGLLYVIDNIPLTAGPKIDGYQTDLYAIDPVQKTIVWSYPLDGFSWSSPAVEFRSQLGSCPNPATGCTPLPDVYDILYVVADKTLYGFDVKQNHNTLACSTSLPFTIRGSSPATSSNVLFLADTQGNLLGFDTTQCKSGSYNAPIDNVLALSLAPGGSYTSGSPVIANGMVYLETLDGMFALK